MPPLRASLALALALAAGAWAEEPLRQPRFSPQRAWSADELVVHLRENRNTGLFLVPTRVDGRDAVWLLDTGASHSVVTPALARRAGLDSRVQPVLPDEFGNLGREPIPVVRVRRLDAGGAAWEQFDALVLDLAHLETTLGEPLDGILGMNVLGQSPFTLDLAHGRLGLHTRAPRLDAAALPSRVDRRRHWVRARLNGENLEFLLDTGSSRTFVADPLGPEAEAGEGILPHASSTPPVRAAPSTPSTLSIGSHSLSIPGAQRQGTLNLLGVDALRGVKTVVDPGRQRVWVLPPEADQP